MMNFVRLIILRPSLKPSPCSPETEWTGKILTKTYHLLFPCFGQGLPQVGADGLYREAIRDGGLWKISNRPSNLSAKQSEEKPIS